MTLVYLVDHSLAAQEVWGEEWSSLIDYVGPKRVLIYQGVPNNDLIKYPKCLKSESGSLLLRVTHHTVTLVASVKPMLAEKAMVLACLKLDTEHSDIEQVNACFLMKMAESSGNAVIKSLSGEV